jgi:hypothetical protein
LLKQTEALKKRVNFWAEKRRKIKVANNRDMLRAISPHTRT